MMSTISSLKIVCSCHLSSSKDARLVSCILSFDSVKATVIVGAEIHGLSKPT